jgi:predicted DNA-binding WGR domain protein
MSEWKVHLEFEEDNSSKFWRARVEGKTLYVNYGRIGSAGQTQMKDLGSPDAAQKELEKLEREKRKKGYHDAGGGGEPDEDEAETEDEDEDEEEEEEQDEDEAPAKRGKPAPPAAVTATFSLTSRGRKVEAKLVLEGTKLRVEADEAYGTAEQARAAFDRLKQALAEDGYKP